MFVVTVPSSDVDLASDVLWSLGVRAIEERHGVGGTVELWTAVGETPAAVERADVSLSGRWSWRIEETDPVVADTWRDFAHPMWVGDHLVVVPAWQTHGFDSDVIVISIEPGGAFGLGDHPTTRLSLAAVHRETRPNMSVLDVGCGTGLLAVAAVRFGAARARAVDIAEAAVEATVDNAHRNGVSDQVIVDAATLDQLDQPFDLVVANILAPTLVELAPDLCRLTAPGGRLVISGILADRHDHVLEALEPLVVERTDTRDGWAAVTLRSEYQ